MKNLLSLCMIVKNEEKVLRRCLDSVAGLVDEIIIVDTGSTDTTKEIAFEYTQQVYDFKWINDFAAARNESIRRAAGKWILWLDADEYVQQETKQELRELLKGIDTSSTAIGITLPILSFLGNSEHDSSQMSESKGERIFANGHGMLFEGAIHEQLISPSGSHQTYEYSFYIYHTGYTAQTNKEKDKTTRNLTIFKELIQKNQLNRPYDHFTIANEYARMGDFPKALYYYEKAYRRCKEKTNYWLPHCTDRMIVVYKSLKKYKEAYQLVEECLNRWPQYPDFHTVKGLLLDTLGYDQACQREMENSIRIADELASRNQQYWLIHLDHGKLLPYQKLAEIFYKQRDLNKTVFFLTKILNIDPKQFAALYKLAHLLSQKETDQDVITFFEKLYTNDNPAYCLMLFQTFLQLGQSSLCRHYYSLCMKHEVKLSDIDYLRYYLIINESGLFEQKMKETDFSSTSAESCKLLLLAALTWNKPDYLAPLGTLTEEGKTSLYALGQALLNFESSSLDNHEEAIYTLMIDLFAIKSFEAYDSLINRYISPSLLNKLAHYFYKQNFIEMALNYYSILLDNQAMETTGFYNLAMYYLYEGSDREEGLQFLAQAIELEPDHLPLYATWLEHCTDKELNKKYKEQLDTQLPSCRNIQFA